VTRRLRRVDASDVAGLLDALRRALDGTGPAIQPVPPDGDRLAASGRVDAGTTGTTGTDSVPDEVAVVIATSGSSGYPKRVGLSAAALLSSATATVEALGGPGRWLLAMPAHYIAGVQVLVRSIVADAQPILLPRGGGSVADLVAAVAAGGSGRAPGNRLYTALVPAQLARFLDESDGRRALSELDAVVVGGQAVPIALRERAAAAGVRLVRTYGSSETAGGCVYDGRPLSGVDVRIADGQIEIGGSTLAWGYLGDPQRTAAVFADAPDGRWFRTGDTGTLVGGVLDVVGRVDNVIVSGGVNVSLDRVEATVRELPGLRDAVVVSSADERWGAVPVVVTVVDGAAHDGAALDGAVHDGAALDLVREAVERALGVAARPAEIVVLDSLPMLSTGKPDRRAIAREVARLRGAGGGAGGGAEGNHGTTL
jgi:O-succinylbenzoic acid--CoA ligase